MSVSRVNLIAKLSRWGTCEFACMLVLLSTASQAAEDCAKPPLSPATLDVKTWRRDRNDSVKADGRTDDTAALQAAIDEMSKDGGTVFIPDGVYLVDAVKGLQIRNHLTLRLAPAAVLKALPNDKVIYSIVSVVGATDVNIIGGVLQGERDEHRGKSGEWGMGLSIRGSNRVQVQGLTARDTWGDGFYVADRSTEIAFCSVVADNNRRQGLSIVSVDGMVVSDSTFRNTNGTAPRDGIDIEPDAGYHVRNVRVLRSNFIRNGGYGLQFYVGDKSKASISDVHVINGYFEGNIAGGVGIHNSRGGRLEGNRLFKNGAIAILLKDGSEDFDVVGNSVDARGKIVDQGRNRTSGNSVVQP